VLNLSANGGVVARESTGVTFLDEFLLMAYDQAVPELTLFDTHVPPGHPVNSRRFRISVGYRNWDPFVHVDSDRCLGTLDRDRPLVIDPAQAVFVVMLVSPHGRRIFLTVRIQVLIEHMNSMNSDACVPWGVWGRRGVAVMEVPISCSGGCRYLLVQGVRVILAKCVLLPVLM